MKFQFHIFFVAALVALSACNKTDLGTPCPPPADGSSGGSSSGSSSGAGDSSEVDSPATFRKDSVCESFLCVSSQTRSNYCSAECFSNSNCPDGFVCEILQPVGEYATTKFCLLQKVCNSDSDCPKSGFHCNKNIPTSVPGTFAQFCDVK